MEKKKKPTVKIAKKDVKKAVTKANDGAKFLMQNKHLLIAIGVGVGGYLVYRGIKKGFNGIGKVLEPTDNDQIKVKLNPNNSHLTITPKQAELMAKSLHDAFNYSYGTDEDKIEAVFDKIKNADDYKLIYNTFGYRPWVTGGTPTNKLDKYRAEKKDLNHWLKNELSSILDWSLYRKVKARIESAGMEF